MLSNLEATGKPNLMANADTNLTTPKTMQLTNQNADLPFSKSASDTATSAKNLHVAPLPISNNISATRKSSESTFRTGKFLFVVDLNVHIYIDIYQCLQDSQTTITLYSFSRCQNAYCHHKFSGQRSMFNQAWDP